MRRHPPALAELAALYAATAAQAGGEYGAVSVGVPASAVPLLVTAADHCQTTSDAPGGFPPTGPPHDHLRGDLRPPAWSAETGDGGSPGPYRAGGAAHHAPWQRAATRTPTVCYANPRPRAPTYPASAKPSSMTSPACSMSDPVKASTGARQRKTWPTNWKISRKPLLLILETKL